MRFTTDKIESARNFANKLWNSSRFILMNLGEGGAGAVPAPSDIPADRLRDEDRWILGGIARAAADITRNIEAFDLSVATQKIYELIWNEYCDWYIEFVKPRLTGADEEDKQAARYVLIAALSDLLRLLHPFMPFITEEIWSFMGKDGKLIADSWPAGPPRADAAEAETYARARAKIETVKEVVRAVRAIRTESGAAPSRPLPIVIKGNRNGVGEGTEDGGASGVGPACGGPGGPGFGPSGDVASSDGSGEPAFGEETKMLIGKLANVSDIKVAASGAEVPEDAVSSILPGFVVYAASDDLFDRAVECERLGKEQARLEGNIARLRGKLAGEGFTSKAPAHIVQAERDKLATEEDAYEKVCARLAAISGKEA
jgi:valyl-tRNA synthetase